MISEEYIMKLVKDYAKSPAGKAAIKKKYGLTYTDENPSAVLRAYGEHMKLLLYGHIHALIKSITLEDIIVENPNQDKNGIWRLNISFKEDSLHRDSLDIEHFPEGLNNIVLLFAKGYRARNRVHGWWITKYGNHGNVSSRLNRDGSDFLIHAVNDFNNGVGKGVAIAELFGDYKECSNNKN